MIIMSHDLHEQDIVEYARQNAQTLDPNSQEWTRQVEMLVEDVVDQVDPNTPQQHSRIAEIVRTIAQNEASNDS